MKAPRKARLQEISIFSFVLVVVVLLGLNSTRYFLRVDLTENKLFTISSVSRELFREVQGEVHITYYVSDRLRSLTPVPGRIIDLLEEYAAYSHGRIRVHVDDPNAGENLAAVHRYGILPQQIQVIEQNERRVAEVYSGLVFEYLDRSIAVPFVFNPDTLEYSLTLTIRRIVRNSSSSVGVVIGEPGKSLDRDYSMLSGQLGLSFTVRSFKPGEEIPPDVKVLVVIGGMTLPRKDLEPIDRFIMGGGHVLFAVKGLRVETDRRLAAAAIGSSPLLDLLAGYGVEVGREMVLDRSARDYRLPQVVFGQVKWQVIGKYPEWVAVSPQNVSDANPITRRFTGLDLLWPSELRLKPVRGISAEPLIRSSAGSWLMKPPFTVDPFRLVGAQAPASSKGHYVLAYALTGTFPSFFADDSQKLSAPGRIIVIGDVDFASDLMQFSDSAHNALFLENAVEWLSSDSDLLAIKTRASGDQRLDRMQDPRREARSMRTAEAVNVVLIPLLVLAAGLVRLFFRSERHAATMAARRETSGGHRQTGGARRGTPEAQRRTTEGRK